MSDKAKVRLTLTVRPEIDRIWRNHCRKKGDQSRIFSELVLAKWGAELAETPVPQS